MKTLTIQSVPTGQRNRTLHVLTRAFIADPVARWMFPHETDHLRAFPRFAAAFAGRAFNHDTAFTDDDGAGAALWLPPGVTSDQARIESILDRWVAPERRSELASIFKQMDHFHPKEPHWYLPLLGVAPKHQHCGLGSALLLHSLERCDQDKLPAYLESSNSENLTLYRRHGFRKIGEIRSHSSPTLYPMIRKPL